MRVSPGMSWFSSSNMHAQDEETHQGITSYFNFSNNAVLMEFLPRKRKGISKRLDWLYDIKIPSKNLSNEDTIYRVHIWS